MTLRRRKSIAWIALAALLFGAVSPAFAAALFADRPEILGRMLGLPAPQAHAAPQTAQDADDDGCPHASAGAAGEQPAHAGHHDSSGHESNPRSEHAAHGAFCSFCLTANSVVTVPAAGSAASAVTVDLTVYEATVDDRRPARVLPGIHHSRDPPPALS